MSSNHPIRVRPARPLYRFAATTLGASMWFFSKWMGTLLEKQMELYNEKWGYPQIWFVQSWTRKRGFGCVASGMGRRSRPNEKLRIPDTLVSEDITL
ncbi:hypothetical protein ACJ72_02181 [Emergomyces africanus]|uniref:Uncharacterized protein n=1 Tax=Emergomyces africanus TaxID=1955775 RepID=A0A1B7P372_9EURO|nr:hypothetical protein ACJ72_02181 [Emergomyces africanus]